MGLSHFKIFQKRFKVIGLLVGHGEDFNRVSMCIFSAL